MLLIPCPHCGPRDEGEFTYGGPKRPLPSLDADRAEWQAAMYEGRNKRGKLVELWYHTSGCETWAEVIRDTSTHAITSAIPVDKEQEPR